MQRKVKRKEIVKEFTDINFSHLADIVGLSRQGLYNIFTDELPKNTRRILRIIAYLDVDIQVFFEDDIEKEKGKIYEENEKRYTRYGSRAKNR